MGPLRIEVDSEIQGDARLPAAFVSQVLLSEALLACFVASEEESCMVITERNHMRFAIDQLLFEAHMKFRQL